MKSVISRKAVVILPMAFVLLTGCGPGETDPPGRTAGGSATTASPDSFDQLVKFAQCLRKHGVDVADPKPGGGLEINSGMDDKAKVDAATRACKEFSPIGEIGGSDSAQRDRDLKVAQCLRRHGIRVKDPQGGQGVQIEGDPGDQPGAAEAMAACLKEVPFVPGVGE